MTTNYPDGLDVFAKPGPTTRLNDAGYELDLIIGNIFDTLLALETQIGVTGSTSYAANNGAVSSIVRDSAGRVTSLVESGVTTSVTRNAAGRVATITTGPTTRAVTYNSLGQVTGIA